MGDRVVGLDEPEVAAELARERIRSESRSSNARYVIQRVAGGDRFPLQSLCEQSRAPHLSSQPSTPRLPPSQATAPMPPSQPPDGTRKQRRAQFMERQERQESERERHVARAQQATAELDQLIAQEREVVQKLKGALAYAEAAPMEMRRHKGMAHDVVRQGERLLDVVHRMRVPTLRDELALTRRHQIMARRVLEDPERWQGDGGRKMALRELRDGGAALEKAVEHVHLLLSHLGSVVGELRGELAALRSSSAALADSKDVDAAEEWAGRVRRAWGLAAYGEWGAELAEGGLGL